LAISTAAAGGAQQLARHVHVGGALREGDGDEIDADLGGRLDVVHVLAGQRRRGQAAALAVDALVVGQLAADDDAGVDLMAAHAGDLELQAAVVEQQDVAMTDVLGQILVVEADALLVAERALGVEDEGFAGDQRDLAVLELADADLRPLQVARMPTVRPCLAAAARIPRHAPDGRRPCRARNSSGRHRCRLAPCAREFGRRGGGAERGNDLGVA
jgi:hypothetical protein